MFTFENSLSFMKIKGAIDLQTRCTHYHSDKDIVALKFACCNAYYPCYKCHEEFADHSIVPWKKTQFNEKAIYCGNCSNELSINEYLNSGFRCPFCLAQFNPACEKHCAFYFEQ
jgi:uncharacterized CHY-type Zn-finger protein